MIRCRVLTVIVTYNAYKGGFFPLCLQSVKQTILVNEQYQLEQGIYVVDSASADGTASLVQQQFPEIAVFASDKNLGYAGGNNVGIKKSLAEGFDYIAVVTQDVFVNPNWLLEAVAAMETDPYIGVVQPLILLADRPDFINSTGNMTHFLGYGYAGDYLRSVESYHNTQIQDVVYPSGACLLLNTKALTSIGLFDDEMWMYNEDQDLGWRMQLAGYRCVLAPQSRVRHKYEFSRSISKIYYMDRNRLICLLQNYDLATLVLIMPALLANELATALIAWYSGWGKDKLAVWQYFCEPKNWQQLLNKRRQRQLNRRANEKQIVDRFTGQILFQEVMSPLIRYVANPVLGLYWAIAKRIIFW